MGQGVQGCAELMGGLSVLLCAGRCWIISPLMQKILSSKNIQIMTKRTRITWLPGMLTSLAWYRRCKAWYLSHSLQCHVVLKTNGTILIFGHRRMDNELTLVPSATTSAWSLTGLHARAEPWSSIWAILVIALSLYAAWAKHVGTWEPDR